MRKYGEVKNGWWFRGQAGHLVFLQDRLHQDVRLKLGSCGFLQGLRDILGLQTCPQVAGRPRKFLEERDSMVRSVFERKI